MRIRILAIGKIKEKSTAQWISEFEKRLSRFCRLETIEIKEAGKAKETQLLRSKLKPEDHNILLAIDGKRLSSEDFSQHLHKTLLTKNITFIIGGAEGIGTLDGADLKLSLSTMTFTHQIARLLLLEQIYRAFTIIKGTGYHK